MSGKVDHAFGIVESLHAENGRVNGVHRHRKLKQGTEGVAIVAGLGMQTTSIATGTSMIAAMGGAVIGTGGIALLAAGGTLAVGSAIASGRSANKTYTHIKSLNNLYNYKDSLDFTCTHASTDMNTKGSPSHAYIAGEILDYIIHQKKHKFGKKSFGAVGGGLITMGWAAGRAAYKKAKGVKGEKRNFAAQMLATHLITHNCVLTERICIEVLSLSEHELTWLKAQNSDTVATLLAQKMKSK